MKDDRLISLYVDMPSWQKPIKVDDFLITIGKKQSNSVYHVAEIKIIRYSNIRKIRNYVKVYRSDLITALKRDKTQKLITMNWYNS